MTKTTEQYVSELKEGGYVSFFYDGEDRLTKTLTSIDQNARESEREKIIKWCDKRCTSNIMANGTDKWNGDIEDLIESLKQ